MCDCGKCCKKSFACGGLSSLLFSISLCFHYFFLYFNVMSFLFKAIYCVHDSNNYLCVTVPNAVKSFACGGFSSLLFLISLCSNNFFLYFNFMRFLFNAIYCVHYSINYLCATVVQQRFWEWMGENKKSGQRPGIFFAPRGENICPPRSGKFYYYILLLLILSLYILYLHYHQQHT